MDTVKQRDNRFDFYKGVLIFGVVYGHMLTVLKSNAGDDYAIHQFIRTYDMPMFAFISGYFLYISLSRNSLRTNIQNKIVGILYPSLLWEYVPCLLTRRFHIVPGSFWFTYSLFFCLLIILFIESFIKQWMFKLIIYGIVVLLFHTVIVDPYKIGFLLPPCIIGFYYHNLIKKRKEKKRKEDFLKVIVVFLFCFAQCFWKVDYNVWNTGCCIFNQGTILNQTIRIIFRFSIGILGVFSMMWFFNAVYLYLTSSNLFNRFIANAFVSIGKVTIELYILQCYFIRMATRIVKEIVKRLGSNPFTFNENLLVLIIAPIMTAVVLCGLYYFQKGLKRIPFIGRYSFSIPLNDLHGFAK